MATDILAKSINRGRHQTLLGTTGEQFDFAVRTLHYPLTPEVKFSSIRDLRQSLEITLRKLGESEIDCLSIHGHGKKYDNGPVIEMGDDLLHHSTLNEYADEFRKIGRLMSSKGRIEFLQCFAGAGEKLMPALAKLVGVPVAGEIKLNGLSPVLEPVQNVLFDATALAFDHEKGTKVGAGKRTYHPDGSVVAD